MKRWYVALLCFVFLIAGFASAGTTGKIAGSVKDKNSRQSLPGVNIVIEGTSFGAATDVNGEYFILSVPPGLYRVTASILGYGRVTQTEVRVRIDQTTTLNFEMIEQAIQAGEVTIVAEKPKVELDLTASKESITRDEITQSWGREIKDVVADIPGANINGGIRGSFGLDVSYRLDGLDMRDIGSNTNFTAVNLSTIQEVEILTGGWNAEFGQANGSIVNIVTRRATDRIHAIATYRLRPAGKYHWGRNFYGDEDIFRSVMTTPEFWDPSKTWKTPWMETAQSGIDGGTAFFKSLNPQQRADWWKRFTNDKNQFPQMGYAERNQWEQEFTAYGPLTQELGFLLSARYLEGVSIYPSAMKYNPEMTVQGSLNYTIREGTKFEVNGVYTKFENSGPPRTNYQSSETMAGDVVGQQLSYIIDPYSNYKYWLYGSKGSSDPSMVRPPEKAQLLNIQAKFTHMFDAKTFLEVAVQHSRMSYKLDFRDIARSAWFPGFGLPTRTDSINGRPAIGEDMPTNVPFWSPRWGEGGDVWRVWTDTRSVSLKADLTSQITKNHLLKTGIILSLQHFDKMTHEGGLAAGLTFAQVDDIVPIPANPIEGAVYLQDKMEFGGMVVNAGLRLDFFNANKSVSSDIYDPLMISAITPGSSGTIGRVGYDPNGSGPGYVNTPTRVAISPRIGISHPITETTVLHFMFGVFNQRPAWDKILANPVVWTDQKVNTLNSEFFLPETTLVTYRYFGQKVGNPGLTWERMTQYEIGFEQNIADLLSLDVTMYYKDAYDLTSLGISQGPTSVRIQESGGNVDVRLYGDPTSPDARIPGAYIGNFNSTVNGAWADVRGIEAKLSSRLRWINFDLGYTLSYLATGQYHNYRMYKVFDDGTQRGLNTYVGASNTDDGSIGLDDDGWNPHGSAMLKISIVSPDDFGPQVLGVFPFADWTINSSTRWVQGNVFTYYPSGYTGVQTPNNMRWQDRWNTNLSVNRTIRLFGGAKVVAFVQVTNLFNSKHLRLFGTTDMRQYQEQGILPFNSITKEPTEWSWYTNLPRQITFGTTIEF